MTVIPVMSVISEISEITIFRFSHCAIGGTRLRQFVQRGV
jgi:hypothetical protein